MPQSKFTEETKKEIIKRYRRGVKVSQLCEDYGVPQSTLYKWLNESTTYIRRYSRLPISNHQIYQMERKIETLQTENDIFKKSGCGIKSSIKEKIEAIERLKGEFSVNAICKTLNILRSTYYHHERRAPQQKWYEIRNETLRPLIKEVFDLSKERFGAAKIAVKLKERGVSAGKTIISKLMKEMGLVCKQNQLKSYNTTNRSSRYRKNHVKRNFNLETPNTLWVSDVTYMLVGNEDCYICVVIDLFSRKIISYNLSKINNTEFVMGTFDNAFNSRGHPTKLTFHSDQGTQYTSYKFRAHLRELGVLQSFSNPGTPYDNAVAENFFSIMKRESLSHKWYQSIEELKQDVEEFMSFFNGFRPLSRLGNLTPNEYEKRYFENKTAYENETQEITQFFQAL